ncbi:hypothetical protein Acr_28g0002960 [Actinidia rufa]|uniref:Uncharacterized protein n=1 Tax=Actinidia rufa TaxID=165716 RepID=A0A7J0H9G4_9ERIC|nr:hypothetical protein Acr_28g0002960 [Actinidia rufa]
MTRRITRAPVKGVLQGAIVTNPLVLTLDMESEVQKYLSCDPEAKPKIRLVRPICEEDHLARLGVYEGKTDPMDHLYNNLMMLQGASDKVMCKAFSETLKGSARVRQKYTSHLFAIHQKDGKNLKDYIRRFNQAVLEIEDPSDKVIVMAMMEELRLGPMMFVADRPRPTTPERGYFDSKPTDGDIQTMHGVFGLGACSTSSRKRYAMEVKRRVEEEVCNLSSPMTDVSPLITFTNEDLRGLHLPHDDALVVSVTIANYSVQRILIDNGSSADILFISAFDKMKIGKDKLHPFRAPLIGFGITSLSLIMLAKDELVSFMDAFFGYHQIKLHPSNIEKTSSRKEGGTATRSAEFTYVEEDDALDPNVKLAKEGEAEEKDGDTMRWKIFVDRSSNCHGCGVGLILQTHSGGQMEYAIHVGFKATNNEVKYCHPRNSLQEILLRSTSEMSPTRRGRVCAERDLLRASTAPLRGEVAGMPTFRTTNFDKETNEMELRLNLDLLGKKRESAQVCQAAYKHQTRMKGSLVEGHLARASRDDGLASLRKLDVVAHLGSLCWSLSQARVWRPQLRGSPIGLAGSSLEGSPMSLVIVTQHGKLSYVALVLLPASQGRQRLLLGSLSPTSPDRDERDHLPLQHGLHSRDMTSTR